MYNKIQIIIEGNYEDGYHAWSPTLPSIKASGGSINDTFVAMQSVIDTVINASKKCKEHLRLEGAPVMQISKEASLFEIYRTFV